jgi:peptide/nickel transport system substrate-binding protein
MSQFRQKIAHIVHQLRTSIRSAFSRPEAKKATNELAMSQVAKARSAGRFPTFHQWRQLPGILTQKERLIALSGILLLLISGFFLGRRLLNSQRVEIPAVGGTYTEGLIGSPQLINPLYASTSDVDNDLARLIYSGLMRFDANSGLQMDLAEEYTVSEDLLTYTFSLRQDALWHDGEPVRAEDVVFTFAAIQNLEYRSPLDVSFADITVEQVDEYTVRFTLDEPYAPFLSLLTVGILPSHIWEDIRPLNAAVAEPNLKPIGSGPYQFEKFLRESDGTIRSYTLIRNSDYYLGAPYIEELTFKFYPDIPSAVEALRNNNVEGIAYLPMEEVADFEKDNSTQLIFPSLWQYTAAFYNQDATTILADDDIREALALATNKDLVVASALSGYGSAVDSFILPGMLGYSEDLEVATFDQEAAVQMLEDAGWTLEEGSAIRTSGGTSLNLTITTLSTVELVKTAEELKRQWLEVGVNVTIEAVSSADLQNTVLKNRDYEILLSGELYGIDPDPYAFWHSSQTASPGLNLSGFSSATADDLIEDARNTSTREERAEDYLALQELVLEEQAALFLYQPSYTYAQSSKIKHSGIGQIVLPSDRFSTVHEWYMRSKYVFRREQEEMMEEQNEVVEVEADEPADEPETVTETDAEQDESATEEAE